VRLRGGRGGSDGGAALMPAPRRIHALTRSDSATSAMKTSRIALTSPPANILAALSSCCPSPPAPTKPSTTEERIAHSQR